ncbi:MAG: hypothetical protein ACI9FR_000409 [Cryomorphaceae bacterium]
MPLPFTLERGQDFDKLILVTDHSKVDWVRAGVPHPTLLAEARALIDKPIEIWNLIDLVKAVVDDIGEE